MRFWIINYYFEWQNHQKIVVLKTIKLLKCTWRNYCIASVFFWCIRSLRMCFLSMWIQTGMCSAEPPWNGGWYVQCWASLEWWASPQYLLRMALHRLVICWDRRLQAMSQWACMCDVRCTPQSGYSWGSLEYNGAACAIIYHWASGGSQHLNVKIGSTVFISG